MMFSRRNKYILSKLMRNGSGIHKRKSLGTLGENLWKLWESLEGKSEEICGICSDEGKNETKEIVLKKSGYNWLVSQIVLYLGF